MKTEPKTGYGTQTSKEEFSIPKYFRKNNLPLTLNKRQPVHSQELRECLSRFLACGDDVVICYNGQLIFGDGDLEHVSLIQSFDNETDTVLIIDPARGVPKHRKANLKQLSEILTSNRAGEQIGLWIIRPESVHEA